MTLTRLPGEALIDCTRPLAFTFDGRDYTGFAGDTLASALLANGLSVVSRSFKLHRPRGIFSAGIEEPNALVSIGEGASREVNVRATEVELCEGLVAHSQNCWPSVGFDLGSVLDRIARCLPAGFYYKTFRWPSWSCYEWAVRRFTAPGRASLEPDPDRYAKQYVHCDVLVVGGGPSGLASARAAAIQGEDVVLIEHDTIFGGSALIDTALIDDKPAPQWVADTLGELASMPNVRLLPRTMAFGHYDDNLLVAVERLRLPGPRQRLLKIRAQRVVLATGAIERPLVFCNNDRPGILLASALRTYARRYGVCPGSRAVIFTNNDSAYETAFALHERGVDVAAIVDVRRQPGTRVLERARAEKLAVHTGCAVVNTRGRHAVRSVAVAKYDAESARLAPAPLRHIDCDLLGVSGGWNPTVHLYSQAGGKLRYDTATASFVPDQCAQQVTCVGAANGEVAHAHATWRIPVWGRRDGRHRQWVDLAHDVTVMDVELAATEGFLSVEHLKRYTTTGMAVDQGKTGNVNALALLASASGRMPGQVGTTTFRPPFHPVTIGALAGGQVDELAQCFRRLPVSWHEEGGAAMEDHAGWLRPAYYLRPGESPMLAIDREVRAARHGVVLFDSSSLGKIEIFGPDAAEFLNRLYVNNVHSLQPGCLRYGLMLTDNGIIFDDGVFGCLGPGHYLVNTSSAGALNVHFWMEEWLQCEWRQLRVWIAPQTAQWATLTLSGPKARAVLDRLGLGSHLAATIFPHMRICETELDGMLIRVRRASFTGEVSFELDIAADQADALWRRLLDLGAPHDIMPLGMEALDILRIEKGFFEVGVDTDGDTSPLDVGWAAAIARKAEDFIGRRSLQRVAMQSPARLQLVGLAPDDPHLRIPVGAHALDAHGETEGHVTSSCMSAHLGCSVALALIRSGAARKGESVRLDIDGLSHPATVVDTTFYDPKGERLRA